MRRCGERSGDRPGEVPLAPAPALGATVVETLTALLLTLLILTLLASLAVRQRRVGEILARRSEVVEARRVTRDLVELAVASGGVRAVPGDEMELRFFVGWALPCADGP